MSFEGMGTTLTAPLVVVMVGLPARGKTYTARKLALYLRWLGYSARVFNVGEVRRRELGARRDATFFDPRNARWREARRRVAAATLDELLGWLDGGGQVALYDATNSTLRRRRRVREACQAAGAEVLFIEVLCDHAEVIDRTIRRTKLSSPDYRGVPAAQAMRDFRQRIALYEQHYQTVSEDDCSYVKIHNLGQRVVTNRVSGYLPAHIVQFLMNVHTVPRSIWLSRHGQSMANLRDVVGGDEPLSPTGQDYARRMGDWVHESAPEGLEVWTSTLRRAQQTSRALDLPYQSLKALEEIDAGLCDGMSYAEIREQMPRDWAARKADKLRYRYPRGESYEDLVRRLDPVLMELERVHAPVLVVAHQAVLRALIGYFTDRPRDEVPHLRVPLHSVIELKPVMYRREIVFHPLGPDPTPPDEDPRGAEDV